MSNKNVRNEKRIEYLREYHRRPEVAAKKEQYKKEKGIVSITSKVYKSQKEKLAQFATERGITISVLIKLALEEYCDIDMSSSGAEENQN